MKSLNQKLKNQINNFIYWHRSVVQRKHIEAALHSKITIEIDLSFDEVTKKPYIGHSNKIYNSIFDKLLMGDASENISFEDLIDYVNDKQLCAVFDCKSDKVLKYLLTNSNKYNFDNVIFHAFIGEWCFDKENRRYKECIKLEDIKKFKNFTKTFWIGSSLIKNYSQLDPQTIKIVTDTGKGVIDGISFFTHYYQLLFPKLSIYKNISDDGYIPVFASDLVFMKPNFKYIGVSNFINNCTKNSYEK